MGIGSLYNERLLPRLTDAMCGNPELEPWRRRTTEGLAGTIVEIGFGSGPNLGVYPDAVDLVYAVEPSELARSRAARRLGELNAGRAEGDPGRVLVEHVGLNGESLALASNSCDGGLSTFTLCTIPDVASALAELHRVIRAGGRFHFLEHGIAPDDGVAAWQRRLEPVQRRLAGGCHLTRDVCRLVTDAGFRIDSVESRYARGPKPWTYFTLGHAVVEK